MKKLPTRAQIEEWLEKREETVLLADGLDAAFLGIINRCGQKPVAIYDREQCIQTMAKDGMTRDEAEEYFDFNTQGAWVGEQTPGYLERIES